MRVTGTNFQIEQLGYKTFRTTIKQDLTEMWGTGADDAHVVQNVSARSSRIKIKDLQMNKIDQFPASLSLPGRSRFPILIFKFHHLDCGASFRYYESNTGLKEGESRRRTQVWQAQISDNSPASLVISHLSAPVRVQCQQRSGAEEAADTAAWCIRGSWWWLKLHQNVQLLLLIFDSSSAYIQHGCRRSHIKNMT